jgi:putative ABC transport system permease protein
VLLILTIGIGSSAAIFSVIDHVLLTPLPYRDPQRLVRIFGVWEHGSREGVSSPDFDDYRHRSQLVETVAAAGNTTPLVNLKATGEPEQISSRNITAGFFSTLGVVPVLGREFLREEEAWQGARVAILSFGLWQRQFGGDTSVVGRSFSINGSPYTVVGVLPRVFDFLGSVDLYTPLQSNPVPEIRGIRTLSMIGRLKNSVDLHQAQSEFGAIARSLEAENSRFDRGWSVSLAPLDTEVVKDVKLALLMLLGAVALLLVLVSANVASLVLSRSAARRAEISLRLSLGASHARIVRQLLTETSILALAGGAGGCIFAWWLVGLIKRGGPPTIPRLAEVAVDGRVLLFAVAVSILVGIVCGLEPAFRARRHVVGSIAGTRTFSERAGIRDGLVVMEVAISMILLIASGLLIQSLWHLEQMNPGFRSQDVVATRLAVPTAKYRDATGQKLTAFWDETVRRVEGVPGVAAAALTSELPLGGLNNPSARLATTTEGNSYLLNLRSVSPRYAAVMRIPLLAGRFFSSDDQLQSPRVAVISSEFQKDVFGDLNPIGQWLMFNFQNRQETENYRARIVGVVGGVRHVSLGLSPFREVYLPVAQSPLSNYDLVVRTRTGLSIASGEIRRTLRELDSDEAIGGIRTLDEVVSGGLAQPRFRGYVLGMFASFALLLTAAGLYGLLSFQVTLRFREIGIRVAIGATPSTIFVMILARGMRLVASGVALGLVGALLVVQLLSSFVFDVRPTDPTTFGGAILVLAVVALAAEYVPARRAMRLDPIDALRHE